MVTPTITESTTRPVSGLTPKGKAVVLLVTVRDRWDTLSDDQKQECADLVARLSVAMRRENVSPAKQFRPLPLVGRISA
jgi:hypothetical protein